MEHRCSSGTSKWYRLLVLYLHDNVVWRGHLDARGPSVHVQFIVNVGRADHVRCANDHQLEGDSHSIAIQQLCSCTSQADHLCCTRAQCSSCSEVPTGSEERKWVGKGIR